MCLLIHIGISYALTEVPWNSKAPAFHVERVNDDSIVKTLNSPFVYYIGAREKCGCGFYYQYYFDDAELEDNDDKLKRIAADEDFNKLKSYLGNITDNTLQLMVAYGDFGDKMIFQRQFINLSEFEMKSFRDVRNGSDPIIYTIQIPSLKLAR